MARAVHVVERHGVADAAPRRHDGGDRLRVEISIDRQAEIRLVRDDGGLEPGIEYIGEIRVGERKITETLKVLFELRHARHVASLPGIEELLEKAPRVVIVIDG